MVSKEIQITEELWPDVFRLEQCRTQLNIISVEYTKLMKKFGMPVNTKFTILLDKRRIAYDGGPEGSLLTKVDGSEKNNEENVFT